MRPLFVSTRKSLAFMTALLDLVVPPRCLCCGEDDACEAGLCERCVRRIPTRSPDPCPRCAAPLGPGAAQDGCAGCDEVRPRFVAAVAAAPYAGFVGELVRRTKYGRDRLLAYSLGEVFVSGVASAVAAWPVDVVVPVPSSPRRRDERGFDLAELLAARMARAVRRPLRTRRLVRVVDDVAQAALPRSERRLLARSTFAARPLTRWLPSRDRLRGSRVLLVDDVLTTGATAGACTTALLHSGVAEVRVAVVARA